jgi:hypothetical protein
VARDLRPLWWTAIVNVVLHVIALVLSLYGIRPGTRAVELADRIEYLSGGLLGPWGWTLGWLSWMACVPALLRFLILTRCWIAKSRVWATVAVTLALVGAVFDLSCDLRYIVDIPSAAWDAHVYAPGSPRHERHTDRFVRIEKSINTVSLVVANGLYSIAILIISFTLPKKTNHWVGVAVAILGLILSASAFVEDSRLTEASAGATILLFCVWVMQVAYVADARNGAPES